jgi:hypothetical protein
MNELVLLMNDIGKKRDGEQGTDYLGRPHLLTILVASLKAVLPE